MARAKELDFKAFGISDHGTISGCIQHWKKCKKNGIKPILGIELYCPLMPANIKKAYNRSNTHMVIWAKNKTGWQNLLKLVSQSNEISQFYYKPRIYPWNVPGCVGVEAFADGLQGFSGHQGSHLSDNLFCDVFTDFQTIKNADKLQLEEINSKRRELLKTAYNTPKGLKDPEYFRQFLKEDWLESTCELALSLERVFGKGNFFIELQNEFNPEDTLPCVIHPLMVDCLREVAKETGIPAVASSDPHYPTKADAPDQRMLISIQLKKTETAIERELASPHDNVDLLTFFGNDSFYIHSYDEMSSKFTEEELEMTNKIADEVEEYNLASKPLLPKFHLPKFNKDNLPPIDGIKTDSDRYLLHLCIEGAKTLKPWKKMKYQKSEYWERLQEELSVIFESGLSDYFLIVQDVCMAADNRPKDHSNFDWHENRKNNGEIDPIPRGVGRGSAAGCLISYLIRITDIDPLEYGLMFERFYNAGRNTKDRVSLPDIDLDFSIVHREWIVDYLKWKYGRGSVGKMITFGTLKGRAAIKDVFKVKDVPGGFDFANQICKNIPDEASIADELKDAREHDPTYGIIDWTEEHIEEFRKYCEDEDLRPIIDQAKRIENTLKSHGKHPAGIVLMPDDLDNYFPKVLDTKGKELIIGFDMHDSEELGGVKLDILGTAILDKLHGVQNLYNKSINVITPKKTNRNRFASPQKGYYDFKNVNLEDPRVWALIGSGMTKGMFQIESRLGVEWCKKLQPQSIDDLSDVISLVRPGPLESGQAEVYFERRWSKDNIEYINPVLEPILKGTQGVLTYQEQAIQICIAVAGFSKIEADMIRKAIGKKIPEEMAKLKALFTKKASERGLVTEDEAAEIFSWIETAQRYSFNKSHGISYAQESYLSAYQKCHMPTEYYCEWLRFSGFKPDPKQEIYELVTDAKLNDIEILPPNIKNGSIDFDIIEEGKIVFGLKHIRGIGDKASEKIQKIRHQLDDWNGFLSNVKKMKKNVAEGLIKSGACDCYGIDRLEMIKQIYVVFGMPKAEEDILKPLTKIELAWFLSKLHEYDTIEEVLQSIIDNEICISRRQKIIEGKILYLQEPQRDTNKRKAVFEKIYLGLNLSCSAVDDISIDEKNTNTCREIFHAPIGERLKTLYACVDSVINRKTSQKAKNPGQPYCILSVSDNTGALTNLMVWPDMYEKVHKFLYEGSIVSIKARKNEWKGREQLIAQDIEYIG